jgi:hypothetical protein
MMMMMMMMSFLGFLIFPTDKKIAMVYCVMEYTDFQNIRWFHGTHVNVNLI